MENKQELCIFCDNQHNNHWFDDGIQKGYICDLCQLIVQIEPQD